PARGTGWSYLFTPLGCWLCSIDVPVAGHHTSGDGGDDRRLAQVRADGPQDVAGEDADADADGDVRPVGCGETLQLLDLQFLHAVSPPLQDVVGGGGRSVPAVPVR